MLDPKEEKRFEDLKAMCRELKVPAPPEIMIGLKVHDKDGVLTFDDKQRGHSWTRNFWNMFYAFAADGTGNGDATFLAGKMSGKRTGAQITSTVGYAVSRDSFGANYGLCNAAADGSFGIVVGTGDTAFTVEDFVLAAIIGHGNAASQLYYQAMTYSVFAYNGGAKTWKNTLTRIFNNNSGGSITVKETALYWYGFLLWSSRGVFMTERSVLAPTVAVANGAQLTVTYEISMDFSAID